MVAFVLGPMFVAVYWPRDVQPDGGAAVLEGAGESACRTKGRAPRNNVSVLHTAPCQLLLPGS